MGCNQGVPRAQDGHDSDSESSDYEYRGSNKSSRNGAGSNSQSTRSTLSSHMPPSGRSHHRNGHFPLNPINFDFQPVPNPALDPKPISFDRAVQHGKYRTTKIQIYKPQLPTPACTESTSSGDSPDDDEQVPLSHQSRGHHRSHHHRRTSSKIHQRKQSSKSFDDLSLHLYGSFHKRGRRISLVPRSRSRSTRQSIVGIHRQSDYVAYHFADDLDDDQITDDDDFEDLDHCTVVLDDHNESDCDSYWDVMFLRQKVSLHPLG